ncbi:MAG: peptidase M24, partial [Planctomycetaceae bacterium]|nr:peptidase M24 [Planctomycetaceae bacterium]
MTDATCPAPQPYHQTDFPPEEFASRRRRVFERIGSDVVAVVQGLGASGAFDIFRQTNEFYYLSGVELPHACLLLEGATRKSILYLPPRDAKLERSEGALLYADDKQTAMTLTGVDDVRPLGSLADDVRETRSIYAPQAPAEGRQACRDTLLHARGQIDADPFDGRPSDEAHFRGRLAATAVHAEFHDLSPILDELRMIKSPRELALMRRAGRLTALAVNEAIRSTRPGLMEYQLGAVADYVFSVNGARGGGYRPIIACGSNIWNAHYYRNNAPLVDGELILMDYAPDCGYYTSDIGRIWPVNGTYSPWQRELYSFIVEYHKALLRRIRPGVTADVVMDESAADMEPVVEQTA